MFEYLLTRQHLGQRLSSFFLFQFGQNLILYDGKKLYSVLPVEVKFLQSKVEDCYRSFVK